MGLSISVLVSLFAYLSITFVRTGRTLEKIKNVNMTFVNILHLPSNGVIAKIVFRDLELHFEGRRFESRPPHSDERPYECNKCEY